MNNAEFITRQLRHDEPKTGYGALSDFFAKGHFTDDELVDAAKHFSDSVAGKRRNEFPPRDLKTFVPNTLWCTILRRLDEIDYARNPRRAETVIELIGRLIEDRGKCVLSHVYPVHKRIAEGGLTPSVRKRLSMQISTLLDLNEKQKAVSPSARSALLALRKHI
ncbi:MAG: hypothetical protein V1817_04875 [Candidatus Micrarchaeota archaeon]